MPLQFVALFVVLSSARSVMSCDDIVATNGWIREPPPVATVAAGYLQLENRGDQTIIIDSVESSCCASAAMHETVVDGDQMRMSAIEALILPPHGTAEFVPGGAHLMLNSPSTPIRHGQVIELIFYCSTGGSFRVKFDVLADR